MYNIQPKTNKELKEIVAQEISKNGNNCNLNHIDTSLITEMSFIFMNSEFNGDISKWDISNVDRMTGMFYNSKFNGDISNWNTSKVVIMSYLFERSFFNGDVSKWDTSKVLDMDNAFLKCNAQKPNWYIEDSEKRAEYFKMLDEKNMLETVVVVSEKINKKVSKI